MAPHAQPHSPDRQGDARTSDHDTVLTLPVAPRELDLRDADGRVRGSVVPLVRAGRHGPEPVGAYVLTSRGVRYRPAVDGRQATGLAALACATAAAVALGAVSSRRTRVGPVTMGPGGWVSVRAAQPTWPSLRAARPRSGRGAARPWWAHLLRARRLVVEP